MATTIEYALMAGASYISSRSSINLFPVPSGWLETKHDNPPDGSGFEAVSFINGVDIAHSTEIVISYAGTGPGLNVDWIANFALALGTWSDQLGEAAAYYLQVKALNQNATISFTGHSLGGGLASLMSVFFGGTAQTFDQAPFAASATVAMRDRLVSYLESHGYTAEQLAELAPTLVAADFNPAAGAVNVTDTSVAGEALSLLSSQRIGVQASPLDHGPADWFLSSVDLHSQALLSAFMQSDETAATGKALNDVTYKLTNLLKMIFDDKLFKYPTDPNSPDINLLDHLVRHEAGVQGVFVADRMVERFASDLWKLAQDGGLTLTDGNPSNPDVHDISNALIAFAMQKYYEETDQSAGYKKELFTDLGTGGNGIRFDMADVSEKFNTAFDNNQRLNLKDAKGFDRYFKYYLSSTNNFTLEEQQLINPILSTLRDWYVQAGSTGMNATDTQNRGAFLLGGTEQDTLTGGTAADLLVGNAGADTLTGGDKWDKLYGLAGNDQLTGGKGNDYLEGGQGTDAYRYTSGDGTDTLLDADHQGQIHYDGMLLNGGKKTGDYTYRSQDGKFLYTLIPQLGNLLGITGPGGNLLVKDFTPGDLNITLSPADPLAPVSNALTGDQIPTNLNDDLDATAGTDAIYGLAGNDLLSGHAGQNGYVSTIQIYGGTGNDILYGEYFYTGEYYFLGPTDFQTQYGDEVTLTGPGARVFGEGGLDTLLGSLVDDTLDGGVDADYLEGELGHDTLLGGAGNDILNGNEGRDVLQGDANDDRLGGGAGADVLVGGANTDYLYGDSGWFQPVPWDGTTYTLITGTLSTMTIPIVKDVAEADAGADMLLGGAGSDRLYGGAGDDFLDGGNENDRRKKGDRFIFQSLCGTLM